MRNTNSPPSYGQPGQSPPGAQTRPTWAGQQGGPQGMPVNIEAWRQRMQSMPGQQQGPMQGPAGLGQMAGMIAQRFGQRGQQPQPGAQPPMPGGEQMPGGAQPQMPSQSQAQARPQPQQGMAGLGQAARAMYDKARVNALRGRGGGGRAEPGNMQEV